LKKSLIFICSKKYPLLVYVYGGPTDPVVKQEWEFDWKDFLVSNYDIAYASIDGRGNLGQVTI
jgi:dipeptidyl aminopeptidase/acylaminoacyl peptidase